MILIAKICRPISIVFHSRLISTSKFYAMNRARSKSRIDKYRGRLDEEQVSSTFEVFVICTGNRGYSKTLVIRTDHDRYMFNCGEGTMKNYSQVGTSPHAFNNIFFTYNSWSNIGGLLGSMMSINSSIVRDKPVLLHGPPYVEKVLGMTNYFSQMEAMNENILSTFKCRGIEDGQYQDMQLTVEYVKLECQSETQNQSNSRMEESGKENETSAKKVEPYAMAYIITPAQQKGKVDIEKMRKLNLKAGRWLKDVVKGLSVILDDGRQIAPENVLLEATDQKQTILVFECPTTGFLDSLVASEQLELLSRDPERLPFLIAHMSPINVTQDSRYKDFMDRFGPRVSHLMMNEESKPPGTAKQLQFQTQLNYIHPTIFPLISIHSEHVSPLASRDGSVVNAMTGLKFHIHPKSQLGFRVDEMFCFDERNFFEEWKSSLPEPIRNLVDKEYTALRENIRNYKVEEEWDKDYPEISFLGTGSAEPNIKRNASGILLQMRKDEYILMDCGEGTLTQLQQLYGVDTDNVLINIKAIFISHLHYDHHGGVFNVMEARSKLLQARGEDDSMHIIGPQRYNDWLDIYETYMSANKQAYVRIHSTLSIYEQTKGSAEQEHLKVLKEYLNLQELVCVPVHHTKDSYGLIIKHTDGWKLVYSGDTRPCDLLEKYGKDCDILIHEGTFDNDCYMNAIATKHSTTGEAVTSGQEMCAKFTILTHFSQRMHVIPKFSQFFTENVGFSFDLMKLKPRDLWLIPLFKPLLTAMFPPEAERKRKIEGDKKKEEFQKKLKREQEWQWNDNT